MIPTYDPKTQTWFTEDGREAPTLALLSLGQGCPKLEGYYPYGVPLELIKAKMDEQAAILGTDAPRPKCAMPVMSQKEDGGVVSEWKGGLPPQHIGRPMDVPKTRPHKNNGRPRKYDWDGVVADRRAGLTYQEIVEKRHMPGISTVAGIINAYNKQQRTLGRPPRMNRRTKRSIAP